MQMVLFAYLGVELIGVTAGEAQNPKKTLAKAIDNVFWRILIFYVGALFVMMAIYPWNELGEKGSPFVLTFQQIGIAKAAGIINFVVLTAALSSCNGGLFSTGRMLFTLAQQKKAPERFGRLNKNGIPSQGIVATAIVLLVGVILNYLVPAKVFTWLTSISTFGAIWTWGIILVAQIKFRKGLPSDKKDKLTYKMPLHPLSSYFSLGFLGLVLGIMAYSEDTRIALIVGPIWLFGLAIVYYIKGFHKIDEAPNSKIS